MEISVQSVISLGTESLSLCVLQPEFESQFDVEALEKLLNIIPADIPSRELCLWFKSVIIPFVRRIVPKGQVIVCLYFIKDIINFMGTFFILYKTRKKSYLFKNPTIPIDTVVLISLVNVSSVFSTESTCKVVGTQGEKSWVDRKGKVIRPCTSLRFGCLKLYKKYLDFIFVVVFVLFSLNVSCSRTGPKMDWKWPNCILYQEIQTS